MAQPILQASAEGLVRPFNLLLLSPPLAVWLMVLLTWLNAERRMVGPLCRRLAVLALARAVRVVRAWWTYRRRALARGEFPPEAIDALHRREVHPLLTRQQSATGATAPGWDRATSDAGDIAIFRARADLDFGPAPGTHQSRGSAQHRPTNTTAPSPRMHDPRAAGCGACGDVLRRARIFRQAKAAQIKPQHRVWPPRRSACRQHPGPHHRPRRVPRFRADGIDTRRRNAAARAQPVQPAHNRRMPFPQSGKAQPVALGGQAQVSQRMASPPSHGPAPDAAPISRSPPCRNRPRLRSAGLAPWPCGRHHTRAGFGPTLAAGDHAPSRRTSGPVAFLPEHWILQDESSNTERHASTERLRFLAWISGLKARRCRRASAS